ncbi:hypothetical protein K470DRAFT_254421 [Piedraia hortae CBS 480.64]|uniref:Uncharacterized protein n=1 Tax=Piedraia hortae CBS 480.64 TaxID=1314780 RepID=A0A6A7CAI1_9PEZI|nr:hypothetical protein K470DRAFT_254421 [Piedraia hortae CBS 480.64]
MVVLPTPQVVQVNWYQLLACVKRYAKHKSRHNITLFNLSALLPQQNILSTTYIHSSSSTLPLISAITSKRNARTKLSGTRKHSSGEAAGPIVSTPSLFLSGGRIFQMAAVQARLDRPNSTQRRRDDMVMLEPMMSMPRIGMKKKMV